MFSYLKISLTNSQDFSSKIFSAKSINSCRDAKLESKDVFYILAMFPIDEPDPG